MPPALAMGCLRLGEVMLSSGVPTSGQGAYTLRPTAPHVLSRCQEFGALETHAIGTPPMPPRNTRTGMRIVCRQKNDAEAIRGRKGVACDNRACLVAPELLAAELSSAQHCFGHHTYTERTGKVPRVGTGSVAIAECRNMKPDASLKIAHSTSPFGSSQSGYFILCLCIS
jgi:hypothetical protein